LSKTAATRFEPRKTPIWVPSIASVTAIMQATIQVLREQSKSKLTTTRAASRSVVAL
jgi:hypothetical protein